MQCRYRDSSALKDVHVMLSMDMRKNLGPLPVQAQLEIQDSTLPKETQETKCQVSKCSSVMEEHCISFDKGLECNLGCR